MKIALFVPCYVDQFYPDVATATWELLERFRPDDELVFPEAQTCCGQPMANSGCDELAAPLAEQFLRVFAPFDYIVCPSGSCTAMVRMHYEPYLSGKPGFAELQTKTFELCEFLVDVCQVTQVEGRFPHRVGLHASCHGLRELRLAPDSERRCEGVDKTRTLLESVQGVELVEPSRRDECCGFGGTFAVAEEAVSVRMGQDRLADFAAAGAEVVTAGDMSCLMHLQGLLRRQKSPLRVMHVAEILAGRSPPA